MDPRDPDFRELEAIVDRSLRAQPAPRAPETLVPRVMAAVAAAERARASTRQRPWFTWPAAWQAASLASLTIVVAATYLLAVYGTGSPGLAMPAFVTRFVAWVSPLIDTLDAATRMGSIVFDTYLRPVVGYLLAWVVLMSAACATFALALGRVALGGASH